MTENPLPPLFSAPGCAFTAPELSIIVISSSVNEEITPDVEPSVTVELLSVQVPNCFDTSLFGVSCVSATGCVAVGYENGIRKPAAASWNGKHWTVTPAASPPAGKISLFDAVACLTAANCVAAGHQGADAVDGTGLSGFWNGKSWRLVLAV